MPDLDDARGIALATLHALTTVGMIVGVPVLVARRIVRRRALVIPAAGLVAAGLTVATQRTAWSLVRLWLRIEGREPRAQRSAQRSAQPSRQPSGR
jgi:hypothetical protein